MATESNKTSKTTAAKPRVIPPGKLFGWGDSTAPSTMNIGKLAIDLALAKGYVKEGAKLAAKMAGAFLVGRAFSAGMGAFIGTGAVPTGGGKDGGL